MCARFAVFLAAGVLAFIASRATAELVTAEVTELTNFRDAKISLPETALSDGDPETLWFTHTAVIPPGSQPVFLLDLGADHVVRGLSFWNYGDDSQNKVASMTIRFATAAEGTDNMGASLHDKRFSSLERAGRSTEQELSLGGELKFRYARLTLTANAGGNRVGFADIQFDVLKRIKAASHPDGASKVKSPDALPVPVLDARHWGMFVGRQPIDFTFYDLAIFKGAYFGEGGRYDPVGTPEDAQTWWDEIHKARLNGQYQLPIMITQDREGSFSIDERKKFFDRIFDPVGDVRTYPTDLLGIALGHEITPGVDVADNELYDYLKFRWPELQVYKFYSYPVMPLSFASGVAEKCDGYLYDDYYTTNPIEFRRRVMKCLVTGKPLVMTIWATEPVDPEEPALGGFFGSDWVPGRKNSEQDGLVVNAPHSLLEKTFWNNTNILREFGLPVGLYGVAPYGWGGVSQWWAKTASPNLEYIVDHLAVPLREEMQASDGKKRPTAEFSQGGELTDARMSDERVDLRIETGGTYSYVDDFRSDGQYIGLGTIDDASIRNFSNLLQTPSPEGVLITRDDDSAGEVELIYRFFADRGTVGEIQADLTGTVLPGQSGVNLLGLSRDGNEIRVRAESSAGVGDEQTLRVKGGAGFDNVSEFYVHVRMSYDDSLSGSPANRIRQLNVEALHRAGG